MSQLLAPTHTMADSIPLGRRIHEIMLEKGAAYTISAMAKRLEMNRETLRLMLKGEREIYTFELEKIAADLKVSVERILQVDTAEVRQQVSDRITDSSEDYELTKKLAEQVYAYAIGYTERCHALNYMGSAYYRLKEYKKALSYFYQALPEAGLIYEKFGDPDVYMFLMVNILNIKVINREFASVKELLLKCDQLEISDERTLAILAHHWSLFLEEEEGDIEGARKKQYESMNHYLNTKDLRRSAIGYLFVAQFEYRQTNYAVASEYFEKVLPHLPVRKYRLLTMNMSRDYGSLLIRYGRHEEAVDLLEKALELVDPRSNASEKAQLLFLLSVAKQDATYAEDILNRGIGTRSIQKIVCQFLIDHYKQLGDAERQAVYVEKRQQLPRSPIDSLLHINGVLPPHYLLMVLDHCVIHRWILNDR